MGWDRHTLARRECDKKAAMAAAAPVPSKQAIRSKLRALEGMAVAKRPQSANNTLGLTDTDEMIRLQAASVAARLRPKSAEGENVTSKTAARALLTNSSDAFMDRQSGFIPTNHGFLHTEDPARGRRRKAVAYEVELASRVGKTLSEVKNSYFPRSKNWSVRAKLADTAAASKIYQTTQAQHRVAGGSFVVYQGQPAKLKKRNENQYRQMAMLQNGCVLTETECAKLREQFTKTSDGDNPTITFSRFLQVMKSIGLGGRDSEVEFFQRLYRVFDADRNGQVDFEELYTGLSSLLAGSARAKLQMFFDMYFTEERQTAGLSKFNVYKLFMAMLQFFGSPSELVEAGSSPTTRARSCEWTQVFRKIDVNHDGVVSFEELYLHVLAHPELCSFLDSAVLRFGAEVQYSPEEGAGAMADSSGHASSTAPLQKRKSKKSKGLTGITERGSAAVNRALRQSALTNKVANRRNSYAKPWKQESKLEKTLPARRCSSDPSEERQTMPSAAALGGDNFLPRLNSASDTSVGGEESSTSTSDPTAQLSSRLHLELERSDSADSTRWSTEGTPPGSPTESPSELMPASVRSGATSVRERPITDSPSTWLLKNKKARQFVTASKTSNEPGGTATAKQIARAGGSSMYSLFR